ncbi:DUF4012 domain-containing protein [Aeromicrobium wangtongii]|uniref:DUF4012 domain-containing protein n=1 Tax=Aeromicrobium wangtongii TaxID=2969247 RepID=UPI00201786F3|nr:DUF4012 domain-containing protein [Aeromicrobium wangtongii]MCL3817591.1 DUF4012 domain-containing protein [Aeromicrobium wangtongii]
MIGGFALLGLVVVGLGAVFTHQALQAKRQLNLASAQASELRTQISVGDVEAARTTLRELQTSTASARSATEGMLWDVVGRLPVVGGSAQAAQTVSQVLAELAGTGLQPIVDAAGSLDSRAFSPRDGRVDIAAIQRLTPALVTADRTLTSGRDRLASVRTADVIGPLREPLEELKSKIAVAQSGTSAGVTAAEVMPRMLGADGPRSYLLVVQNNAEVRSTGGLPGAFAVVQAADGRIRLTAQGAGSDFGSFDEPVVPLTKDELGLYTRLMGMYWSDANFTPDFPRTGQILRAMYDKKFGDDVDGVISVDPVALSYLLKATGPIELAKGSRPVRWLTSRNVVPALLNQVYLALPDDNDAQDAFFAAAAARVFRAVASGSRDPQAMVRQMTKAASEDRLLVWSAHDDEQDVLAGTRVAGDLPGDSGTTPHVGVYLNDSTATKLEYYLQHRSTMHAQSCTGDDVQTIEATTVLTSSAPRRGAGLPRSILGPSRGARHGAMRFNVRIYAPHGGEIDEVSVDDDLQTVLSGTHRGRDVTIVPVRLSPGHTVTIRTVILTGKDQADDPVLSFTPTVERAPNSVPVASACGR